MKNRLRRIGAILLDVVGAAGFAAGTFWIAYATGQGNQSSISPAGIKIGFVHELLFASLLTFLGLLRGIQRAWTAERDREALIATRSELEESETRERALRERLEGVLKDEFTLIAHMSGIGSDDRVSYFIDDEGAGGLRLVHRWSSRQAHRHIDRGRLYDYTGGCLGEAWDSGEPVYANFPNADDDPGAWAAELERQWKIPTTESSTMTLKAQTVYARRVDTAEATPRALGVVMVESKLLPADPTSPVSEESLRSYFGERLGLMAQLYALAIELYIQHPAVAADPPSCRRITHVGSALGGRLRPLLPSR